MALPVMTPQQRAAALEKAARVRTERAEAKAKLAKGTISFGDVLADETGPLWPVKVEAVLRAVPGIGKVRAAELMEKAGVAEDRRIRGLGANQRTKLKELVAA